ncbi:hypothetical protein EGW08_014409 [Elysia chlorotica]|uniref:Repulsive guidance molecule N-terminal domain-containing protein n=1 Tax=Elysia chlorotica TaxID=188477 RepID=A0A3S1HER1_ELYCH|nr:hypothetical protein EGW08_014409 [Elysia chlorotica]
MAYGVFFAAVHREEVSQTTVAARGLLCPAFAWKGMGSSGYHKPPALAISSYPGFIILMLSLAFMSGNTSPCNLKHCMDAYSVAENDLFNADPALQDRDAICAALSEYKRCIMGTKGCASDLLYHTVRTLYIKQRKDNGCPEEDADRKKPKRTNKNGKNGSHGRSKGPLVPPAMCVYQGPKVFKHCGLFGDPHLRTFHGEFQTCKVEGATGNHLLLMECQLTVIVKGNPECASQNFLQYQAQSDSLPSTFDDGQVQVGPYHSVELVEVEPGAHVEIHIRYISTVVVVRRIGRYLTFSIQMPESLINGTSGGTLGNPVGRAGFSASVGGAASFQGVQLCLRGCPASELINFQDYLAARRDGTADVEMVAPTKAPKSLSPSDGDSLDNLQGDGGVSEVTSVLQGGEEVVSSRAQAEELCREASVVGFYFDFCVFDLMATGDRNFTLSAVSAMQDVLRLDPSAVSAMDNRTSLEKYDQQFYRGGAASGTVPPNLWRTTILAVCVILFSATGMLGRSTPRPHCVLVFLTVLTLLLLMSSR